MSFEEQFLSWVSDGVREAVKQRITNQYSSNPLHKVIDDTITKNCGDISDLLKEAIASCMSDQEFREEIKAGARKALAKTLVQKFGGELEKQVNALKSDPTTRARITLAIDEIVKSS